MWASSVHAADQYRDDISLLVNVHVLGVVRRWRRDGRKESGQVYIEITINPDQTILNVTYREERERESECGDYLGDHLYTTTISHFHQEGRGRMGRKPTWGGAEDALYSDVPSIK